MNPPTKTSQKDEIPPIFQHSPANRKIQKPWTVTAPSNTNKNASKELDEKTNTNISSVIDQRKKDKFHANKVYTLKINLNEKSVILYQYLGV